MWHHAYGDALRHGDDLRADADRFRIAERARQSRTSLVGRAAGEVTWARRAAARVALATAGVAIRLARVLDASVAGDEAPGRPSAH